MEPIKPITARFIADNLERTSRVLADMQSLIESNVDRENLFNVLSWALESVQREIHAAARVLREQSAPRGDGSPPEQPGKTIADMVPPERLEELKREFEQAAAMGEQVLQHYLNRHQQ